MAITWTQIGSTESESGGDFTLETKVFAGSGAYSGYLLKIERSCLYNGILLPSGIEIAIVRAENGFPDLVSWTVESTSNQIINDSTLTRQTLVGVPLVWNPGTESYDAQNGRFYQERTTFYYQGAPRPGAKIALTWAP